MRAGYPSWDSLVRHWRTSSASRWAIATLMAELFSNGTRLGSDGDSGTFASRPPRATSSPACVLSSNEVQLNPAYQRDCE
jgi:hypothetical protein